MKIKAQDGKEHITYGVEQRYEVIKGQNSQDRRRKIILGKYKDLERAAKVFEEIHTAIGKGYYAMPEN